MTNLGNIEKVDVREVWPDEKSDFTPWLADNLNILGVELGVELELVQTEAPVGNYSLDILAKDANSGEIVAIENQIEGTDHRHLGQLMTYAAGRDASVVIWVATKFRDEHRAALDWINERADSLNFFGVEIEVIKIGDSLPAPLFRLAVVPNAWSKEVRAASATEFTETEHRHIEFWRPLLEDLKYNHGWNVQTTNKVNWHHKASGVRNITLRMLLARGNVARVEILIDSQDKIQNKRVFDLLKESRKSIERDIQEELLWERSDDNISSYIGVSRSGPVDDPPENLAEIRRWMVRYVVKLGDIFRPYLENALKEIGE